MRAEEFTIGNFKGGVGKTKIATMLAYDQANILNKKTLLIDMDPQANASTILARSGGVGNITRTIVDGLREEDFSKCITPIFENLDLIACTTQFSRFETYAIDGYKDENERIQIMNRLITPLRESYDYIYIDVPPTISVFSDNAMAASDYSIIAFQTVDESLDGVSKYVSYQNFMASHYGVQLQAIDIIPCMTDAADKLDKTILAEAREKFGTAVSENVVTYQKRLRNYSRTGISIKRYKNGNMDQWDFMAHGVFLNILKEIDARIIFLNSARVGE